jgi:hypothetical protein
MRQGTGNREQPPQRAKAARQEPRQETDRMTQLLRTAFPPVEDVGPSRDLWPAVLRKLDAKPGAPPWFDWVIAGGLLAFSVLAPATVPVLLYYL